MLLGALMFASKEMLHFIIIKNQVCVAFKGKLVFAKTLIMHSKILNDSIRHVPIFQNVTKPPVFVHATLKKKVISQPRSPIWGE